MKLLKYLVSDFQDICWGAEAIPQKLVDWEDALIELVLKVQLLAKKTGRAAELRERLEAELGELELAKKAMEAKMTAMKKKIRESRLLKTELGTARASIGRQKQVIYDFAELVLTGFTFLMGGQASSYRDWLNTLLVDMLAHGEYLSGFHVRLKDDG